MSQEPPSLRDMSEETGSSPLASRVALGYAALAAAAVIAMLAIVLVGFFGAIPALLLFVVAIPLAIAGASLVHEYGKHGTD